MMGEVRALRWVIEHGTMGFRGHARTSAVRDGDRFALYVSRGAYHNPTRDETQILGLGRFRSAVTPVEVTVEGETFPKSAAIEVEVLQEREGLPFKPLVPQLSFIAKKDQWFAYVRTTLVPVPRDDYTYIAKAFRDFRRRR